MCRTQQLSPAEGFPNSDHWEKLVMHSLNSIFITLTALCSPTPLVYKLDVHLYFLIGNLTLNIPGQTGFSLFIALLTPMIHRV